MRQVVSNTGPVLHLCEIHALDLLQLTGSVSIPTLVDAELKQYLPDWASWRPAWLQVVAPHEDAAKQVQPWLDADIIHPGEAAALVLARQMDADWFLTDDTAARLIGKTLGMEVHGSLGVVLLAAATGHMDRNAASNLLDRLATSTLWISPRILAEARVAMQTLFAG